MAKRPSASPASESSDLARLLAPARPSAPVDEMTPLLDGIVGPEAPVNAAFRLDAEPEAPWPPAFSPLPGQVEDTAETAAAPDEEPDASAHSVSDEELVRWFEPLRNPPKPAFLIHYAVLLVAHVVTRHKPGRKCHVDEVASHFPRGVASAALKELNALGFSRFDPLDGTVVVSRTPLENA